MKPPSGSDIVRTGYPRIYRVQWARNGYCYVSSTVNGSLIATYNDLVSLGTYEWHDEGRLPDDIRTFAMEIKP